MARGALRHRLSSLVAQPETRSLTRTKTNDFDEQVGACGASVELVVFHPTRLVCRQRPPSDYSAFEIQKSAPTGPVYDKTKNGAT